MSEAQLTTLGTMKDWYTEGLVSLVKFNTDASAYDEDVPKTIKTRLAEAKETCDLALADLNVAIEHAACGKDEFIQFGPKAEKIKERSCCLRSKVENLAERRQAQGRQPRHEAEEAQCKDRQKEEEVMRNR